MRRAAKPMPKSQSMLGVFVDGMPKNRSELPKRVVGILVDEYVRRPYAPDPPDGEFRSAIMNRVRDIVLGLHGDRIVVCPSCKRDVEPVVNGEARTHVRPDDVCLFESDAKEGLPPFVRCEHCDMLYFLEELCAQRSFRLCFFGESIADYPVFLQCVWLFGDMRVVPGHMVVDVTGHPSGDSWANFDELVDDA